MGLRTIEEYLLDKLNNIPGRPAFGVKLLKEYLGVEEHIPELAYTAYDILTTHILRGKSGDLPGSAKLTQVSTKIGSAVFSKLFDSDPEWRDVVRLGDVFIEAFFRCGYITLHYPKVRNSSYIVKITDKWVEELCEVSDNYERYRLTGTVFEKPKEIDTLMQEYHREGVLPTRYPIIKNWDYTYSALFQKIKNLPWLKAANKLQQVGWKINKRVYEAVMSSEITETSTNELEIERIESKKMKLGYVKAKATALLDKTFYSLVDFDYRGRIYYRETMFNFQASDYERGLFLFDEARLVTEKGKRWLYIHAANSFNMAYTKDKIPEWCTTNYSKYLEGQGLNDISVDKMTLKDRELWTENNLNLIKEVSSMNKLVDCEKPVAFLAVCHEIIEYNTFKEFGIDYYSSLPIPIDGSNNGWQHLGAISKDTNTGELVGLVPVDIQQDFYVKTAKKLIEITHDEHRLDILNKMPMKKIRKGISKRGSMTRAYSAGAQKIAENMFLDLRKEGYDVEYDITEKDCMGFSRDLIKAIEAVCPGPLQTMKFLQKIAVSSLELEQNSIQWVTPSGFFVNYENFYTSTEKVSGTILGVGKRDRVNHVGLKVSDKPNIRGFVSGISPNYVHSLDGSHMAIVIANWGGHFGAVHDSFSTHPDDVDDLLYLTKEIFIEMYDYGNYFSKIKGSFMTKFFEATEEPKLGMLDVNKVRESNYFFA